MLYLGIDQHAHQITISLRDESGDVLQARQVSTRPKRFTTSLRNWRGNAYSVAKVSWQYWKSVASTTEPVELHALVAEKLREALRLNSD